MDLDPEFVQRCSDAISESIDLGFTAHPYLWLSILGGEFLVHLYFFMRLSCGMCYGIESLILFAIHRWRREHHFDCGCVARRLPNGHLGDPVRLCSRHEREERTA
jgi:hypothetical protein